MKSILTILISFGLAFSVFGQTRNVVFGTNGAIIQPTNFWSADASNARTGLGLGDSATNPASAFQSSSSVLSNLASSNAINLTNVRATNIIGTVSLATNVSGIVAIANGGTAATTAGAARTNLGLVSIWLTNTNAADFRTNIGLGATWLTNTNVVNFLSAINLGWSALTNSNSGNAILSYNSSNNIVVGVSETNAISFSNSIVAPIFYGSDGTSTNIGGSINIGGNQSGSIDLSGANVAFGGTGGSIIASGTYSSTGGTLDMSGSQFGNGGSITTKDGGGSIDTRGNGTLGGGSIDTSIGGGSISTRGTGTLELGTNGARTTIIGTATTNRSISLPNDSGTIALLTNSSSGISLVTVNTNGAVINPTNFWQVAPIQTLVQSIIPVTNSTNAVTNARNLYVYSLATNIINVTNTITLPTNTSVFDGDEVTVVHRGGSNSVTAVRQLGSTNNLISLNSYDESVKFIKDGNWDFYHNISFTEAIRFSGTNTAANAGASRTNLALGENADVAFNNVTIVDQTLTLSSGPEDDVFVRNDSGNLELGTDGIGVGLRIDPVASNAVFNTPLNFNNTTTAATTLTNLGIPLAALTNTNNATFQQAIFTTNAAPTNAGTFGDHVAWMGVSIVTNGVTNVFKIPLYK